LSKLLIANRGEIATRIARSCRKLGISPCGIYSEADKNSLHVKYCDEAINIGGMTPVESYLRIEKVLDAVKKLGCDLVHPGYGFLAESAEFSETCEKNGITFVGPSSKTLRLSGDKVRAREIASKFAPIVEGKEISMHDEAVSLAEKIGFPLIIKAVKGGGGRGLRIVNTYQELQNAFASSKNEASISFGSDRVYIEKYIQNPRHIEVQIIGDKSDVIHLSERECSVQRRHQKLIEETPSPALTPEIRNKLTKIAVSIAKKMAYTNAGTVEFLYKDGKFYFMELNSRIQVEHPITEMVTGIDIVEQQIHVSTSKGLTIKQTDVKTKGHALECRINAEHPVTFVPHVGTIKEFDPPKEEGVRVDTAMFAGYSIPSFYDSLISKLICFGNNRNEAIEKMIRSLSSFRISGIPTTIPFHVSALRDKRFLEGNYDTSFVNQLKYFSSKEGEIAAALFLVIPKKLHFLPKNKLDLWDRSRFDWSKDDQHIDPFFEWNK
jgi:acetyl-CoA carboxylase, biotin carboxylase subunit